MGKSNSFICGIFLRFRNKIGKWESKTSSVGIFYFVLKYIMCRSGVTFTQPRVHGMVYEPGTGEAKMLDVDIGKSLKELGGIYDLFRDDLE